MLNRAKTEQEKNENRASTNKRKNKNGFFFMMLNQPHCRFTIIKKIGLKWVKNDLDTLNEK